MMLISKNIRQKLTVLAVGSSLFAGCSSGPQLSSIRFWPGAEKMESAADDEAVARKWRDRLNASALSGGTGAAPGFETAAADRDAAESRSSRFNIFRRFSRKNETETVQKPETAENGLSPDQQRLELERKIAQLEAEQRVLKQQQTVANPPQTESIDPRQGAGENDPFLAASQVNQAVPRKQIVRPAIRPASKPPAADSNLPSWAQTNEQNASEGSAKDVAIHPRTNSFAPGFDQTLNNLQATAQRQADPEPSRGKAPAMPLDSQPAIAPAAPNPFAQMEQQKTAATVPVASGTAPSTPAKPQPKLDRPVPSPSEREQLASLRTAEEQQRAWARIEVLELLKHARIQARHGELDDALNTALAAQQLANSADVEFYDSEQTPAQLVSLIHLKAEETRSSTAQRETKPKTAVAGRESEATLNAQPARPPQFSSASVSTKPVAPPQWPGQPSAIQPRQVAADHPLVSTPGAPNAATPERQLKTAEFVHPRPAQAAEPHATTSDQWYSTDEHPPIQPSPRSGGYMETPAAPPRSRNGINAQFVSSKTIYSPENLQWTSLDASLATIEEETSIPAPPVSFVNRDDQAGLASFAEDHQLTESDDPFAAEFDQNEVSDTLLSSDDPLRDLAPTLPDSSEAAAAEKSDGLLLLGIPVRKLGLVLLAGLILLAAIIHRRRSSEFHEL